MSALTLTQAELIELTHYQRPAHQLRFLKEIGIPAKKRADNTILVFRAHLLTQSANDVSTIPTLKSARK
jgi:hypothetical protein